MSYCKDALTGPNSMDALHGPNSMDALPVPYHIWMPYLVIITCTSLVVVMKFPSTFFDLVLSSTSNLYVLE